MRRLVLRPFRRDDVDDVFDYATDPEWACYLPVPRPYAWLNAEEFVGAAVSSPKTRTHSLKARFVVTIVERRS